jgi:hypothetical protein
MWGMFVRFAKVEAFFFFSFLFLNHGAIGKIRKRELSFVLITLILLEGSLQGLKREQMEGPKMLTNQITASC